MPRSRTVSSSSVSPPAAGASSARAWPPAPAVHRSGFPRCRLPAAELPTTESARSRRARREGCPRPDAARRRRRCRCRCRHEDEVLDARGNEVPQLPGHLVRRPRRGDIVDHGTWQARNSCGYSPPMPTPRVSLPPVARSRSAICFAMIAGGYAGSPPGPPAGHGWQVPSAPRGCPQVPRGQDVSHRHLAKSLEHSGQCRHPTVGVREDRTRR